MEHYSPYKDYLESQPNYFELLSSLKTFVSAIRNHIGESKIMKLSDLLNYIAFLDQNNIPINSTVIVGDASNSINLLTSHSAKGLEYESVFIINCTDESWNNQPKSSFKILPCNLQITPNKDNYDDRLKLFYVALTRAKKNLYFTTSQKSVDNKSLKKLSFLDDIINFNKISDSISLTLKEGIKDKKSNNHIISLDKKSNSHLSKEQLENLDFLKPVLENYKLSVTHLNNFLDITTDSGTGLRGGPHKFLEMNLLRFPQSKSRSSCYGTAMHEALRKFYVQMRQRRGLLVEDELLANFQYALRDQRLSIDDYNYCLEQGKRELRRYYQESSHKFNPRSYLEFNFREQNIRVGEAKITGAIDKIEYIPETKKLLVTDYKTGKTLTSWAPKENYARIKATRYQRQLYFYRLLIQNSHYFDKFKHCTFEGALEFLEAQFENERVLVTDVSDNEIDTLSNLVQAVWQKIMNLDFPDTNHYADSLEGNEAFIRDLIEGVI